MTTTRPTFEGVKQAAERLQSHMAPTPLYRSETLSRALDADVWLKVETATPIASFKLRGALNHSAGRAVARRRQVGGDVLHRQPRSGRGLCRTAAGRAGRHLPARRLSDREADDDPPVRRDAPCRRRRHRRRQGAGAQVLHRARRQLRRRRRERAADRRRRHDRPRDRRRPRGRRLRLRAHGQRLARRRHRHRAQGHAAAAKIIAVQSAGSPAMVESFRARRAVERPVNSLADSIVCRVPAATALTAVLRHVDDAAAGERPRPPGRPQHPADLGASLVEPGSAAGLAGAWQRRSIRAAGGSEELRRRSGDPGCWCRPVPTSIRKWIGRALFVPACSIRRAGAEKTCSTEPCRSGAARPIIAVSNGENVFDGGVGEQAGGLDLSQRQDRAGARRADPVPGPRLHGRRRGVRHRAHRQAPDLQAQGAYRPALPLVALSAGRSASEPEGDERHHRGCGGAQSASAGQARRLLGQPAGVAGDDTPTTVRRAAATCRR